MCNDGADLMVRALGFMEPTSACASLCLAASPRECGNGWPVLFWHVLEGLRACRVNGKPCRSLDIMMRALS